ncbi:MAG: hypothetical protein ACM336_03915 [Acidobacteriota bacterium]
MAFFSGASFNLSGRGSAQRLRAFLVTALIRVMRPHGARQQ